MAVVSYKVFEDTETSSVIWSAIASAESNSNHPIAKALLATARQQGGVVQSVTDVVQVGGRGLSCSVAGRMVAIGNMEWMSDNGVSTALVCALCCGGRGLGGASAWFTLKERIGKRHPRLHVFNCTSVYGQLPRRVLC